MHFASVYVIIFISNLYLDLVFQGETSMAQLTVEQKFDLIGPAGEEFFHRQHGRQLGRTWSFLLPGVDSTEIHVVPTIGTSYTRSGQYTWGKIFWTGKSYYWLIFRPGKTPLSGHAASAKGALRKVRSVVGKEAPKVHSSWRDAALFNLSFIGDNVFVSADLLEAHEAAQQAFEERYFEWAMQEGATPDSFIADSLMKTQEPDREDDPILFSEWPENVNLR